MEDLKLFFKNSVIKEDGLISGVVEGCGLKSVNIYDIDGNILFSKGRVPDDSAASFPVIMEGATVGFIKGQKGAGFIASMITRLIAGEKERFELKQENARLYENMHETFKEGIVTLAESIEIKDYYTGNHVKRVARYCTEIGRILGLEKCLLERLRVSAILHDIGKIGIKDDILLKPSRLTSEEYDIMKEHPVFGARLLENIKQLKHVVPGVRQHHERWDGKGYPDGLKGMEIDLSARIISVADSFDAMSARRIYRDVQDFEYAFNQVKKYSGSQFCPECVEAFIEAFANNIPEIYRLNSENAEINI